MELEEAIETLTEYKNDELFGIAGRQALDVVLKELDNRIPKKYLTNLEDILQEAAKKPLDSTSLLMLAMLGIEELKK